MVVSGPTEHRQPELGRIVTCGVGEFIDHAVDRLEGPTGCHGAQLPRRRGALRHFVQHCAHSVIWHGIEEVCAMDSEAVENVLLAIRRIFKESRMPNAWAAMH